MENVDSKIQIFQEKLILNPILTVHGSCILNILMLFILVIVVHTIALRLILTPQRDHFRLKNLF
jgi:hypothetical protein